MMELEKKEGVKGLHSARGPLGSQSRVFSFKQSHFKKTCLPLDSTKNAENQGHFFAATDSSESSTP